MFNFDGKIMNNKRKKKKIIDFYGKIKLTTRAREKESIYLKKENRSKI